MSLDVVKEIYIRFARLLQRESPQLREIKKRISHLCYTVSKKLTSRMNDSLVGNYCSTLSLAENYVECQRPGQTEQLGRN